MHSLALFSLLLAGTALQAAAQYTWKNVHTGAGGGFVPNVVFNQKQKGLAYLRTDIGGAYRLNADGVSWTPLLDWAGNSQWDYWGVESIATDPVQPENLYIEVGLYTNSWDPNNGTLLISNNQGATFTQVPLPFKVGGNMPGRGAGERLAIDPNNNSILYLGARSGHGLYKSTNYGKTWAKVQSLNATGTYSEQPSDTSGYNSDPIGVGWVIFDTTSPSTSAGTSRIFVGVESIGSPSIWVSNDSGNTWSAVAGQNTTYLPHHAVLAPAEQSLYISYVDTSGPFDGSHGWLAKYNVTSGVWTNVTPAQAISDNSYGFGGVSVDLLVPGTVMAASLNEYYPDAQIWRSLDGGKSWSILYTYSYPPPNYQLAVTRYYGWDLSDAPWIWSYTTDSKQIGWGIEGLSIDPFNSNHFVYGTGLTLYGSLDLLDWDTKHNITLSTLSNGVEETAVNALISPPVGANLLSAVSDIGGWTHTNLDVAPPTLHTPIFGTDLDIDYAGLQPIKIVRIGNSAGQLATSADGGNTWALYPSPPSGVSGGHIQYSANATSILWASSSSVLVAKNGGAFVAVTGLPVGAIIKADKVNDSYFYGTINGWIYQSKDGGSTFQQINLMGSATASNGLAVNTVGKAGELYISANNGLWHSTDFGHTIAGLSSGLCQAWGIAVGAPSVTGGTASVFAAAEISGVYGLFRSDNAGNSWTQINDAAHGFASTSGMILAADPRIYKRVYVGTNGRGIFYGN